MSVFKINSDFYKYGVSDILLQNIKSWVSYGFLQLGAYTPITFDSPASGYTNLKRSYDNAFGGSGRVFEGLGGEWVWENVVQHPDDIDPPFQVSGVFVNSTFLPLDTVGASGYKVDYQNGRVIFNSALASSSQVKCEYTLRDIATYDTDSKEWKTITKDYFERFATLDVHQPSGIASILRDRRVWLPCVAIEVRDRKNDGFQLGGGILSEFSVFYHIFADNSFSNKKIVDILADQQDKVLNLYDVNTAPFSLNFDGTLPSGIATYPVLSNREGAYFNMYARIDQAVGKPVILRSDVHRGEARHSIVVQRPVGTWEL
jgi:hypothetical protein